MDRVDLHVHTTASDGSVSPRDVVSMATMLGLKAIALTDHDTMAGLQEAGETAVLMGISVVPGIEISSAYGGKEVHVLGYFLDPEAAPLQEYLEWVRSTRRTRNEKILEKLAKKGYQISLDALERSHPDAVIGRPHIAEALVEQGAVSSVKEAFRRYLGEGRSCYVPRELTSLADAASMIRSSGGVAVLAHPLQYGFTRAELDGLVKAAAEAKFSGMEILYTGYTQADQNKLYDLAEKYLLYPTGGSDFHGESKPEAKLGEPSVPAYMLLMLAQSQDQT